MQGATVLNSVGSNDTMTILIIRGTQDGNLISDYIENNVVRWDNDCFNQNQD